MKRSTSIRLQDLFFIAFVLSTVVLGAFLVERLPQQWDLTQNHRHSLGDASRKVLEGLKAPVQVLVFLPKEGTDILRSRIHEAFEPYLHARGDISLRFADPSAEPDLARKYGVRRNGEIFLVLGDTFEPVDNLDEAGITKALTRLSRTETREIAFLEGHGEGSPLGEANFDYGDFGRALKERGFPVGLLNLANIQDIPRNLGLLVITPPQADLLPKEVERITAYVEAGGNLLWLLDPGNLHGLGPLAAELGLELPEGTIHDPAAARLGLEPTIALGGDYGTGPVTRDFSLITLFPRARPILADRKQGWRVDNLVEVAADGWLEKQADTSTAQGKPAGPFPVAISLERNHGGQAQRLAIVGSGTFLNNSFIGNGGNRDLGINIVNWSRGEEALNAIQPRTNADSRLELSRTWVMVAGFGFLLLLPAVFLAGGGIVWWRRRNV